MAQDYIVLIFGVEEPVVGEDCSGSLVNCRTRAGDVFMPLAMAKRLARQVAPLIGAPVAVVGTDDNLVAYVPGMVIGGE